MPYAKKQKDSAKHLVKTSKSKFRNSPVFNKFALLIFVLTVGVAGYVIFKGRAEISQKVPVPSGGAYWAFSVNGAQAQKISEFENFSGRKPMNGYHWFKSYPEAVPTQDIKDSQAAGRIPLINFKLGTNTWAEVANGTRDSYLKERALAFKSWGKPALLAYHHEPENDSQMGSQADYVAAYRRVVDVFRANGADNVSFALILMGWTYSPSSGRNVDA